MIVIVVVILLQQLRHPVTEIRQCTAGLLLHQVRHGTP
jgi:hypothetical protein